MRQPKSCLAKLSASLVLASAALIVSSGNASATAKTSQMLDCSGLPCVDVTVGVNHLKMLIDTGNFNSVLDAGLAKRLALKVEPALGRDGKPIPGYSVATLPDLRIGDVPLGDLKVLIMDLDSSIKKGELPTADGLLTYPIFNGRILTMDYKAHSIQVSEKMNAETPCPGFCGLLATPTFGKEGPPIVTTTGFQVNGKPIVMQIDTLYSGSMLIYPTSVDKLGLQDQQSSTTKRMFKFTDGGVNMIEGKASVESFGATTLKSNGTLYFATPEVHAPDGMFDGTVGHELFIGHVLTFDFHARRFWME